MTQDSAAISFATSDWAMAALEPHISDCLVQTRKRRHPLIRIAYIARQRETPEERPWNWVPIKLDQPGLSRQTSCPP
jgi:hypothetical protein